MSHFGHPDNTYMMCIKVGIICEGSNSARLLPFESATCCQEGLLFRVLVPDDQPAMYNVRDAPKLSVPA